MTPFRIVRRLPKGPALALVMAAPGAAAAGYPDPGVVVETGELAAMLDDPNVRILDVRPAEVYAEGHIPNAVHLAADALNDPAAHVDGARLPDAEIADMLGLRGVDADTRVVVYDDQGGFHAARLFWLLEYFGHRDAAVLNGGFPKWTAEGREVSAATSEVGTRNFALTVSPRREATADWLLAHENDPNVVVIDVRPESLFEKGHIPWATSIPWKLNLAEDGTLKPADALRAHFAEHGVAPDSDVAIHCQNGKASAHSYWAMRALGHPRLRVYDRSWAEWGEADDLPKAVN